MVSNDGHALLTDFGSSRLAEASFSLVVKGDLEGTLDWMAPEHFKADKFTMSAAGDVWAFGMTAMVSHISTLAVTTFGSIPPGVTYKEAPIGPFAEHWCHNQSYYVQRVGSPEPRCIIFSLDG